LFRVFPGPRGQSPAPRRTPSPYRCLAAIRAGNDGWKRQASQTRLVTLFTCATTGCIRVTRGPAAQFEPGSNSFPGDRQIRQSLKSELIRCKKVKAARLIRPLGDRWRCNAFGSRERFIRIGGCHRLRAQVEDRPDRRGRHQKGERCPLGNRRRDRDLAIPGGGGHRVAGRVRQRGLVWVAEIPNETTEIVTPPAAVPAATEKETLARPSTSPGPISPNVPGMPTVSRVARSLVGNDNIGREALWLSSKPLPAKM
jgi:hypothetical protein